jgi:nucleoside-diphosphate-sugar epimerase
MKVIVTGGLGFIGSNLVDYLLKDGCEVTIVDNLSSNTVEPDYYKNKCEVIISDVSSAKFPDGCDILYHLACFVGPTGILKYAGDMGASIINDTVKVRDYCINNNTLLVDISTSEVYGHVNKLTEISEKVFPGTYKIRTEYGAGKMLGEIITVNKALVDDRLKYHIIRPFNVSGTRQRPDGGFVLPRFVISALTNQPLTIYGDGTQERAFTDVRDICEAIFKIVGSSESNGIWNIGNINNRMSIGSLAQMVMSVYKQRYPNKEVRSVYIDPKTIHGDLFAEAIDKLPYTEKIETKIGWKPRIDINDTINCIFDYYEEKIKNGYYFKVI